MKLLKTLFELVDSLRRKLDTFDEWYNAHIRYIPWTVLALLILTFFTIVWHQIIVGMCSFACLLIIVAIDWGIGWRHSVIKWLKFGFIFNYILTMVIALLLQRYYMTYRAEILFLFVYLSVWILLSLIADETVALFVNETLSLLATTVFTIGTYLISANSKNMKSLKALEYLFESEDVLEKALNEGDRLAWDYVTMELLDIVERCFLFFLPIIGVTALTIVILKVRTYLQSKQ